tara:strand:- start:1143 stop:2027 length:885 start_codon:yes stop_codon:yes gene_type:complete
MKVSENHPGSSFEERLSLLMEENLSNESFGASELADQMNLSRSQLHRKIHKELDKSTTQYIREFRLERAKDLLTHSDLTVAEISYRCGFNSATYFSSVFTHYFKVTPGQFRTNSQIPAESMQKQDRKPVMILIKAVIVIFIAAMSTWYIQNERVIQSQSIPEFKSKSLVVQPFHNLNLQDQEIYICEGIRGAINSRLSVVENLRLIHASSPELRDMKPTEIQNLTRASYLLAGQIQRYQGTIRVEVYLIELKTDDQIWGETYDYEFDNPLSLQSDLAERIAVALKLKLKLGDKI